MRWRLIREFNPSYMDKVLMVSGYSSDPELTRDWNHGATHRYYVLAYCMEHEGKTHWIVARTDDNLVDYKTQSPTHFFQLNPVE